MIFETTPYSISPDWLLRGGYRATCIYREDTKEAIVTSRVRPVGFQEEPTTRTLNDGTLDDVRWVRAIAPEVVSWEMLVALRRWRVDGARIKSILIAATRGMHCLWDEPVPVLLRSFDEGRSTLSGDRLVLHSARHAADVELAADLLGTDLGESWPGVAERVLPIPGLTVYARDATIEARSSSGALLTSATDEITLPSSVWSVRVLAAVRTPLTTRPPAPKPPPAPAAVVTDGAGKVYVYGGRVVTTPILTP